MVYQYCTYSFARNWQLPFLNQRKGENDHRKYFMINLHEECCRPRQVMESATSWSPVGHASNEPPRPAVGTISTYMGYNKTKKNNSRLLKYTVEHGWLEHQWLVYHGKFELVLEFLWNSSDSSRKQIFKEIFLFYCEIAYCVYSLELPHWGDSNEYTQHTITV